MALTSETQPSPNGVNCIEHESADVLDNEDLEDGEIFEDEELIDAKSTAVLPNEKQKPTPAVTPIPIAPTTQKKPNESPKNHRSFEHEKPVRDQSVLFFKGKRKHYDDNEEEGRWKRDGKRHHRSHEFEREGDPGRTRQSGEPGEDDEDMMFVRGASPHRMEDDTDKWEREDDDDERMDINRRSNRSFRGRGLGGRRGDQRQRGRGRGRGGGMRGGKRKREDAEMCVFFLQGKCHRGSECPYAHEILPPRKMELCKFYMKDCCAKKDKCLYMHSEFPCKYFHTGLKCYANKKCKFSHGQLSDSLRNVLAKHLDTAPKDILGEFPRRDRDQRERVDMRVQREMRNDPRDVRGDVRDMRGDFMRIKNDRERKIPSLFDIKVSIPEEMRNSDGNHTPMPSPTQRSQDSTRSSNDRDRENYTPDRDRERDRDKERDRDREYEKQKHDKSERSKEKKAKKEKAREHRKERKERKEKEKEKKRERSRDANSEKNELQENISTINPEIMSPTDTKDIGRNPDEVPIAKENNTEDQDKRALQFEENDLIPQHLPKKQRELFLRIQQQQREAESSQASANDDEEDMDKAAEENWYSSDEETTPSLPPILHSLTHNTATSSSNATITSASPTTPSVMPLLNLLASASAAAKPLDTNKTPISTSFIPPNLDLANLSTVFEALTNLQKMNASANKTTEPQTTVTNTDTVVVRPKQELPKPEPPRVRDPRLREGGPINSNRSSTEGPLPLDVDLRPKTTPKPPSPGADVDLRSLPFKPVQHSAASEIDASLSSHSPIHWQLIPADMIKPDYASLQIQPKPGVNDPRLRRTVRPVTDELGLPRDPRQRLLDEPVRDPRGRQPLLATPLMPPNPLLAGPPPTPRYDEDHRPQFFCLDSDMRQFPPPTPRLEEEVYTPGPSRLVDPRQRNLGFEDPRRNPFPPRPDDIDLRSQIHQRVPFINFNK